MLKNVDYRFTAGHFSKSLIFAPMKRQEEKAGFESIVDSIKPLRKPINRAF